VAIYARTSTEDQAERQTVQGQLEFLRRFCSLYSHVQRYEIAAESVDDGWSGTVPLGERPDGRRLLEDARAGRFQEVLVYRLDRLGRSLRALLNANLALEAAGVTIHSATEPFDTATPIGRFVFQLLGSLAELERSTITERMALGRDRNRHTPRGQVHLLPRHRPARARPDGAGAPAPRRQRR
jgi:site-specific DNA recombinase